MCQAIIKSCTASSRSICSVTVLLAVTSFDLLDIMSSTTHFEDFSSRTRLYCILRLVFSVVTTTFFLSSHVFDLNNRDLFVRMQRQILERLERILVGRRAFSSKLGEALAFSFEVVRLEPS